MGVTCLMGAGERPSFRYHFSEAGPEQDRRSCRRGAGTTSHPLAVLLEGVQLQGLVLRGLGFRVSIPAETLHPL